ncbi:hypothetical protein Y032_0303g1907 [Ancylostoma ceylanicum]|nr:hypothetical protein Y032_0303g1907 [Ancylostoma ceylanicum]
MEHFFSRERKGRIWTWRGPNGTVHNQIDFICSPPSTTVLDSGIVNKFLFDSDHRMVRMELVAPKNIHRNFARPRYLSTRLHLNRKLYRVQTTLLSATQQPQDALESYDSIRSFVETAAEDCWTIPTDPPRITQRTQRLLSERIALRNNLCPTDRIAYSIVCEAARTALLEDIRRRKIINVQKAIGKGKSSNEAQRKETHKIRRLMLKEPATGEYSQETTEALVASHHNELHRFSTNFPLSLPPSIESCPPFHIDEAEHALSQLRLGRSSGPDHISAEQLVLAKSSVAPLLTVLLNSIKRGDPIPGCLTTAHVKLLFTKGDPNNINNFRPISLILGVLKAVTRVILNRIESKLEETESPSQVGFRKKHSTLNHIHILNQIAEKSKEYNFPVYVALVDFKKAFDSSEWNAVWTALERRVTIRRGIKQGDTLSPKLFNATLQMVLDSIEWEECGLRIGGKTLSSLEYADDVALLASSRPMLEKMIQLLANASAKVGLQINREKTTLLTNSEASKQSIRIDGKIFNFADHALYLGCRLSFPRSRSDEISNRIQSDLDAFEKFEYILCSKAVPLPLKKRAFDSCVTPSVLYGAETWALRRSDIRNLEVTQRKMERRMLRLTILNRWSAERMRALTKLNDWTNEATKKKL